jgi:hypothetical protein
MTAAHSELDKAGCVRALADAIKNGGSLTQIPRL